MNVSARAVALRVLRRIESEGAYANLALGPELARSGLDERDRAFTTDLVYGTTRMRRACDHLVDTFASRRVDADVRSALRLGVYQLAFAGVARHAAVSETVAVTPKRARSFVNAVLRRISDAATTGVPWPDEPTRLSYPDWVHDVLVADLGREVALAALEAMNEPAGVSVRADGYVQDVASQWVADLVDARPDHRVADVCAAPGGKATALADTGAFVVAGDVRPRRANLVTGNAQRTAVDSHVAVLAADGLAPPFRPSSFDRVLVDAPCSGLGSLRRRADARWRVELDAVARLAALQRSLVDAAVGLLRPGAILVYSVCTLTNAETRSIDEHIAAAHPALVALDAPGEPWETLGRGALLLPQTAGTDGMYIVRLRRP